MTSSYKDPLKAIRTMCLDCMGNSSQRVTICAKTNCPLWYYRYGKRPTTIKSKVPEALDTSFFLENATKHEEVVLIQLRDKGTLQKISHALGGSKK